MASVSAVEQQEVPVGIFPGMGFEKVPGTGIDER